MNKAQTIALIDANNFYAACEQSIDPSLAGNPVVVLSNNDGCIVARSPEARALGIKMGIPYFKVRNELEDMNVMIRSSNYALYGDMSQRMMSLLGKHCEQLEIYSIDEAFAYINRPPNGDLRPWARQLRALIHQNLGLPIAIGIGASKGQAKLANHLAKTIPIYAGVFDLQKAKDSDHLLETIAIEDVWGIGHKLSRWCRIQGINSARQLRDMHINKLQVKAGIRGVRLLNELRGEACLPLTTTASPKKETCVSRSFSQPINNLTDLHQAIATHTVQACEKLRRQKQQAGAITIFIRTGPFVQPFRSQSATAKLDVPSNHTNDLLEVSMALTKRIFRPHISITKAGVLMQNLQSVDYVQQHLTAHYNPTKREKQEKLMRTIDGLNKRYGHNTVKWAICGLNQKWSIRREHLSHAATTRLQEIPIVHT